VVPALPNVDYCFLNEFEIERTTGVVVREKQGVNLVALRKAAELLITAGVQEWVVVHFPEGACALGRDGRMWNQGSLRIPQSRIVGMVGAGDAFAAGVLFGLHEGRPIEAALHYGVCVAASCLCGAGASDGIRPLQECLKLEKEFGIHGGP
jgi:sugar/nucleoside kinase (ribokinase family)